MGNVQPEKFLLLTPLERILLLTCVRVENWMNWFILFSREDNGI